MTKNITLSEEAYSVLRRIKRKNESFSDVIIRIIGNKGGLSEILDQYPELKDNTELETIINSFEKDFEKY